MQILKTTFNKSLLSSKIWLSSLIAVVPVMVLVRKYFQGGQYKKDDRIEKKVVVITGANCGIGKAAAIELAKRGGKVYIACRDIQRGEAALEDVAKKSGSGSVRFLQLDLASMESIREFSKTFHKLEKELHILINNAGVMGIPRAVTKDGFEMQFGVNHLGHFLLTNLLLDLLKKGKPSRIINVSSMNHKYGKINKDDLNNEKTYKKWEVYGQSKLANILFTRELARRTLNDRIAVNSLHPGAVKTELVRGIDLPTRLLLEPFRQLIFKTPKSGAQTIIRLAVDPALQNITGKYWADCEIKKPTADAEDDETAAWLWKESEKLTGLAK